MKRSLTVLCSAAFAAVCPLVLLPAAGTAAAATTAPAQAIHHATRTSESAQGPTGEPTVTPSSKSSHFPLLPANASVGAHKAQVGSGANAPTVKADTVANASTTGSVPTMPSTVLEKFNGVSNLTSTRVNGFQITPPDQGLCYGHDPKLPKVAHVVWEPVNEAAAEYSTKGALLRPVKSLATLFHDPDDYGDVRCLYDSSTNSFYFTEINAGSTIYTNTGVDVAVYNANGWATYTFSTSMTTHCLGDQPKTGFDGNALVISTDEYCTLLTTHPKYPGAIVLVISLSQLNNEGTTVNYWTSTPIGDAGHPVVGLDPAIGVPGGSEYLLNSVPYLTNVRTQINPIGDKIGQVQVHDTQAVTSGTGAPVVTKTVMTSEDYNFPVRAKSTGTGSAKTVTGSAVYSVTSLNPDDSRMSGPVTVTSTRGIVMLWTAISVSLVPDGTRATRDGVAWFEVNATGHYIVQQGYVAAKGSYLIYPALQASQTSSSVPIVFTATSPTLNPSAAYTTIGSTKVTVVAHGFGPQMTFDITQGFRWGDYSFAATGTNGIWMATEYIPPKTDQAKFANWGTEVFEVKP